MRLKHRLCVIALAGLCWSLPGGALAQISVDLPPGSFDPEPSFPLPPGPLPEIDLFPHCHTRLCGEQHWNFEWPTGTTSGSGNPQGWKGVFQCEGEADHDPDPESCFSSFKLTSGSSVLMRRVLASPGTSDIPPGHEQLSSLRSLSAIGGNYWDVPYHTGYEGQYWLGSFERHSTATSSLDNPRGDAARMDVHSPEFSIDSRGPRYIHFLAGGGCSPEVKVVLEQRVYRRPGTTGCELALQLLRQAEAAEAAACAGSVDQACLIARWNLDEARRRYNECLAGKGGEPETIEVANPVWEPARSVWINPVTHESVVTTWEHVRTGRHCHEAMTRVRWDVSGLIGRAEDAGYRIRVIDGSSTAHVSVDDFWVTSRETVPEPKLPLFGVADLHAHLMNELGTMAYDGAGPDLASRALWGSVFGPIESLDRCNDTHTTNDFNFNSHQDEVFGSTYTLFRDIGLDTLDGAGRNNAKTHSTHGGSGADWADWPLWSSALHQQMHATWVRRAWEGGLRLMVAAVGNAESVAFGLAGERHHAFTSDQDALALQIPAIFEFARQNSSWAEVALSPQDARRIIRSGKLAIVIGAELDHIMDSCSANVSSPAHHVASRRSSILGWSIDKGFNIDLAEDDELGWFGAIAASLGSLVANSDVMHVASHPRTCTPAQIEARLDALYRAGVRQINPMHFADNMLGGYAINKVLFTANSIFGHPDADPPRFMTRAQATANGINLQSFKSDIGNLINVPVWLQAGLDSLLYPGPHLPPGAGRTVADFLSARCIEDAGWRAVAALFSLGASEIACATSELEKVLLEIGREAMPWEGAIDTPLLAGLGLGAHDRAGPDEELPSHINARGLQPDGAIFIREMMRRGMLIDLQHASELSKRDIIASVGTYPLLASHGGAHLTDFSLEDVDGTARANENTLSLTQLARIYQSAAPGIVGAGAQSAEAFRDQLRGIRDLHGENPGFALALGTDMNGFDWHAFPRFGPDAFFRESEDERFERVRDNRVGPRVRYAPYDSATNSRSGRRGPDCNGCVWPSAVSSDPALTPHALVQGGRVVRTFDINFDGYSHYGMAPDFLQEVRSLGATAVEMGAVLNSAEGTIRMWEESCRQAYQMTTSTPSSITMGCGPRGDYL